MEPVVQQLIDAGYPVRKFDADNDSEVAARFRVSAVPSFVLVKNGRVADRIDQATSLDQLMGMMRQHGVSPQTTIRGQSPTSRLSQISSAVVGAITPSRMRDPRPESARLLQAADPPANRGTTSVSDGALAATVRLVVEDDTGHSYGTGTVIDVHGADALVVTCAHIFRESGGRGRIKVERFDRGAAEAMAGSLISFDEKLDVALLSIKLLSPLKPVRMPPAEARPVPGEPVFSIGCNHGESPTVVFGKVNAVNKYLGPENITASGRPVDGRSGGGLFDQNGQLIGVCNAADPELDEGLYAGLARVRQQLDQNNLSFVHRSADAEHGVPDTGAESSTLDLAVANPPSQPPFPTHEVTATEFVSNTREASVVGEGAKKELVCVVRSHGDNGQSRVVVVSDPSPALLRQLAAEANKRP
jgi:S1-C subfamily serine protease